MKFLIVILSTVVLNTCNQQKNSEPVTNDNETKGMVAPITLENKEWKITHIKGESITIANKENTPTLEVDLNENKIYGHGGCNKYFGKIKALTASIFQIEANMGLTKMFCQETMQVEDKFMAALSEVKSYKMENETLVLMDANKNKIITLK